MDIPGKADDVREVDCDQREGFWDDRNAVRQLLGDRLWKHTMEQVLGSLLLRPEHPQVWSLTQFYYVPFLFKKHS